MRVRRRHELANITTLGDVNELCLSHLRPARSGHNQHRLLKLHPGRPRSKDSSYLTFGRYRQSIPKPRAHVDAPYCMRLPVEELQRDALLDCARAAAATSTGRAAWQRKTAPPHGSSSSRRPTARQSPVAALAGDHRLP
jgi:hypothetical protein